MKINLLLKLVILSSIAFGVLPASAASKIPHLDLNMTGAEYSVLLKARETLSIDELMSDELDAILQVGQRNLDWLNFINRHRGGQPKLSLSTAETAQAFPVEQPRVYNPALIQATYQDLLEHLPAVMKDVLVNRAAFTETPPLEEKNYLAWGLLVDRSYQIAARWMMMSPYLGELRARAAQDIRGYYYFLKETDLKGSLDHWSDLSSDRQRFFQKGLVTMCLNNAASNCADTVAAEISKNAGFALYSSYLPTSKALYDSFFRLDTSRQDVKWDSAAQVMHVPFVLPADNFRSFLKDNIEDEWKWNAWHLVLDFIDKANPFTTPHLVFEPGATPHVNEIAGNEITMDENAPLTEYDVQWTIRHEYGHVLGFPDCYHEFYDADSQAIVSYQLDTTDLMCSRRGHFKERHYAELERVYK